MRSWKCHLWSGRTTYLEPWAAIACGFLDRVEGLEGIGLLVDVQGILKYWRIFEVERLEGKRTWVEIIMTGLMSDMVSRSFSKRGFKRGVIGNCEGMRGAGDKHILITSEDSDSKS